MEVWFEHVIRQLILYSFPVLVSLALIALLSLPNTKTADERPFRLFWAGIWLPLFASLLFGRAVIVALPFPIQDGLKAAAVRLLGHGLLAVLGFSLFIWALAHPPAAGLPPLHFWWAKVLMYYNLCMVAMHILPMPTMVLGEWIMRYPFFARYHQVFRSNALTYIVPIAILAATPLLDTVLGGVLIYPVYEILASWAEMKR
ncbi:MAG: hypothetical protein AUK35_05365 [Zetaproteobacteria bacterium CG2_30_46_52]|nr:MAG: hypothetical protein AUK35_05365 [Zetaproteobacteria bacterium CG2_30_46_52]